MNVVLQQAAGLAQQGWLLGLTTVLFMSIFVGWVAWLWSPGRGVELDAVSRRALED